MHAYYQANDRLVPVILELCINNESQRCIYSLHFMLESDLQKSESVQGQDRRVKFYFWREANPGLIFQWHSIPSMRPSSLGWMMARLSQSTTTDLETDGYLMLGNKICSAENLFAEAMRMLSNSKRLPR